APTGLLINVKESPRSGNLIVLKLLVVKWMSGKWKELVRLDADKGMSANGAPLGGFNNPDFHGYDLTFSAGDKKDKTHPGFWLLAKGVSQEGDILSEDLDFYYLPKEKKYKA